MFPSETIESCNFECTRLTFVTSEEVAEVYSSEQANICRLDSCAVLPVTYAISLVEWNWSVVPNAVLQISVAFYCETEYRSEVATYAYTEVRHKVAHPAVACCISSNTTINTNINVVESLTFCNSLS